MDRCSYVLITPSSLSTQALTTTTSNSTFTFTEFTTNVSYCGAFVYTATLSDGVTALDSSIMTLTSSTREFNVDSTNVANVGTYTITVTGALGTYGSSTFTFIITISCKLTSLSEGSAVAD